MCRKNLLLTLPLFIIISVSYPFIRYSLKPSKFELASNELSLNKPQQEALLNVFYLSGYFNADKLWHDISSFDKTGHPEMVFRSVVKSLNAAGVDKNRYNPALLRKNLFKEEVENMGVQDIKAWILYVTQNLFKREIGQERYELTAESSINQNQHTNEYIKAAEAFNMLNEVLHKKQAYDEAWITGASRKGLIKRIIYYNELAEKVKIKHDTIILTGDRPLWVEIDGLDTVTKGELQKEKPDVDILNLTPRDTHDGKEYMLKLASDNKVTLNEKKFIKYEQSQECPLGLYPGRTYLNYKDIGGKKITEAIMAQDLANKLINKKVIIIDASHKDKKRRVDTVSTGRSAGEFLIKKIFQKEFADQKNFSILLISNNPYIERQEIAIQREINKLLKDNALNKENYVITIEGVGAASSQKNIAVILPELAALITEKYKSNIAEKYTREELMYQTRKPNSTYITAPTIEKPSIMENICQSIQNCADRIIY
ncbi:hypothetical protein BIY23_00040 [Wolbachia pipientis]|uniref:Uncharacterized protein n=1 Tax=Wolbachia pipientis TaxID=955 RepID=A0A1E7QK84_WOLPI|nr:hypothetical protein [Wolbachia pipientis]OEY86890.1 hypothetical protein BIY23_00040 [Wolbachia pipientis]